MSCHYVAVIRRRQMPVNILRPNVGALEPLIHRVGVLNVNLGGTLQELRRDINAGLLRFLGAKRFHIRHCKAEGYRSKP